MTRIGSIARRAVGHPLWTGFAIVIGLVVLFFAGNALKARRLVHAVCAAYPDVVGDRELFAKYYYPYSLIDRKAELMGGSPNYADLEPYIVGWSSRHAYADRYYGIIDYEYDIPLGYQTYLTVLHDLQTGAVTGVSESGTAVRVRCDD